MVRSPGFGSTSCYYTAQLRLAFASAPWLSHLTSQHNVTRRPVLQKVRGRTLVLLPVVLPLLVNIRFQVLFHSPPGVLFTFPSRYYTLSVIRSYLALGDGPPVFPPNFSCSMVLRILTALSSFRLQGFYLVSRMFPHIFTYNLRYLMWVQNPAHISIYGLGSYPFARHYWGNRCFTFSSSGY